jgi:hypothetical protein
MYKDVLGQTWWFMLIIPAMWGMEFIASWFEISPWPRQKDSGTPS